MLNAELVTHKNSTSQIKKKYHYLQVFIIIFKGQLREIKKERQREVKGESITNQRRKGMRERKRERDRREGTESRVVERTREVKELNM